jgi:hypothetical protein
VTVAGDAAGIGAAAVTAATARSGLSPPAVTTTVTAPVVSTAVALLGG